MSNEKVLNDDISLNIFKLLGISEPEDVTEMKIHLTIDRPHAITITEIVDNDPTHTKTIFCEIEDGQLVRI